MITAAATKRILFIRTSQKDANEKCPGSNPRALLPLQWCLPSCATNSYRPGNWSEEGVDDVRSFICDRGCNRSNNLRIGPGNDLGLFTVDGDFLLGLRVGQRSIGEADALERSGGAASRSGGNLESRLHGEAC